MSSVCTTCKKPEGDVSLKRCAKCHTTPYCSRECQKADWKQHRRTCGQGISKPFTRLGNDTWLHDRPEPDVYQLLIDSYRMRAEDEYNFEGDVDLDRVSAFEEFLDGAESRRGLLPPWWAPDKREACMRLATAPSGWSQLRCTVEKSDIIDKYGDSQFPMQLRLLAEKITNKSVGPGSGAAMLAMMAGVEAGNGMQTFSINDILRGGR
ncbi:hypothetical protein B0I35DRAFT_450352 [Stachybotrys elegans]|uniref:MYND-type domain-containing protein n=1 Tax=Stachybotrys elegans TaxID=80388 RepID=A0A8K0WV57_9HYPO|nr:hypothetical protein B0I35DRAFT_450352 [Stachybotrys elegans]